MSLAIKPLKENFAGEVSGVDLREPLSKAESRRSKQAWTATLFWSFTISA